VIFALQQSWLRRAILARHPGFRLGWITAALGRAVTHAGSWWMLYPNLEGRVALVTGAGRGIGRAIALTLAEAGADVAVNYREQLEPAEAAAREIRRLGRRAEVVQADVSLAADVARLVEASESGLGPIDILINNAGISEPCGIEELSEALFDRTMTVNLKSAFLCTQAVLPGMRARGFGRIVNISSGAARGAGAVGVHYNASKAAMEGLTRGYAARVVQDGVTVNAVAPSLIATEMIKPHRLDQLPRIPVGRLGTADEIASVVLMVVGNAYITGQTLAANGGLQFN
jgi:3-oxoacyl-[acyl-carrier protein] reductase